IRGCITAFQPDLMAAEITEVYKEVWIKFHHAVGVDVELDHPAIHSVRIKLLVPGSIKGIGEIDTASIAADLNHLRAAVQRLLRLRRMSSAAHDAARVYGPNQLGVEWI